MEDKVKRVAIILDCNGKCKYVGRVKLVNEEELNQLVNEANEIDENSKQKKLELYDSVNELKNEVKQLKNEIKLLKGEE